SCRSAIDEHQAFGDQFLHARAREIGTMLGHPAVQAGAASLCQQLELLEVEGHAPPSGRARGGARPLVRQCNVKPHQAAGPPIAQSRNASIKKSKNFCIPQGSAPYCPTSPKLCSRSILAPRKARCGGADSLYGGNTSRSVW